VKIRFMVPNLRMGGQFSTILSLQKMLVRRGIDAAVLLPEGVAEPSKSEIQRFGSLPLTARLPRILGMMRNARRVAGDDALLHVVLPSPAFSASLRMIGGASEKLIVQYEARCTRLDAAHFRALRDDPVHIAPRLVMNNAFWTPFGSHSNATHVGTYPLLADELRSIGYAKVAEIPNVSEFAPEDSDARPLPFQRQPGEVWLAYIGHCHAVKGVGDLVDAFAAAHRQRPELRLFLGISRDGNAKAIIEQVRTLNLVAINLYDGLVPVARVLADIDALALPYRAATSTTIYPSLLLEANLAGCPVIAGAIPELDVVLDAGGTDTFPPSDVNGLRDALLRVRPRSGRVNVLTLPPTGEIVDRWIALYRSLA
jgi:glycosyltransferase involved in cell wall biosynthesis